MVLRMIKYLNKAYAQPDLLEYADCFYFGNPDIEQIKHQQ